MTRLQERFVEEYLKDLNGAEAYLRAGYKAKRDVARRCASDLLTKPDIIAALAVQRQRQSQRTLITADRVLFELARVAFFDPRRLYGDDKALLPVPDLDDDTAAALASIEVEELWDTLDGERRPVGVTRKVRAASKLGALKQLGQHLGLFEQDSDGHLAQMLVQLILQHVASPEARRIILETVEGYLTHGSPRQLSPGAATAGAA